MSEPDAQGKRLLYLSPQRLGDNFICSYEERFLPAVDATHDEMELRLNELLGLAELNAKGLDLDSVFRWGTWKP